MKFLKMLALTYNSPLLFRYNRLNLNYFFFSIANFSKYSRDEWVKQKNCFGLKVKKCRCWNVSPHLKMKMTKNSNFKTFTASSLTLSYRRDAGSTTGRSILAEPSAVYSYGQSVQKTTFSQTKLNEISENVSSLNLPQSLRYNRLKLNFLFFLNANFSEYSRVEWVK